MLKPLFGKPPHTNGRRTVEREDEPLLFDFVEHICDIVDAPRPAEIEIDCTINAAASFNRGVLSLLGGDLRLTIGISMVAGLNVRQFAGVLAHEFGHFSQGTGMRFSYLIRSISFWFTRVVYERDAWDEKLYRLSEHENPVLRLVLSLTRFGIWLTRRVLWVLMLAGHAVSGFLLRQMEFDADRYESRVAGCKSFSTTSRRMSVLNVAHGGALDDLQQVHDEGRLADDLPQLIVLNVKEIPRKILKQLKKQEEEASTGLFDTHPCHRDRVENAMQDGSEGIIVADHPAEQLFQKFGVRSRSVTLDFYTEIFGGKFKKKLVRPLSELVELRKVQQASMLALRRFFQGHFSWYRSVPLPQEIWTPLDGQTKAVFLQNRQEVLNVAPKYNKAWRKYNKAEGQLIEAKLARTLIDADFSIRPSSFSIPLTSRGQIRQAIEKIGVRQGKSEPILSAFETAAAERMCLTLQTARSPDVAAQLKKRGFRQSELDELLQIHIHLNDSIYQLVEIHDQQMILGKLMQLVADGYRHDAVIGGIHSQMEFLIEKISSLHSSFLQTPYPFDHARAGITLAEFMLKTRKLPTFSDPVELYNAAENVGSALPMIQTRVLGRLCEFSEAVETIFGLTPLDDPPEDDDDENDER